MSKKNLTLLATCQGLMLSCTSLTIATAALVGVALAPDPAWSTLPLGLLYLTVMITVIPASALMKKAGRRIGFALGGTAGICSGLTTAFGIYSNSFTIFCVGTACFGIASSFAHYYRFAATEIVDEKYRSRAISWVLAGGLVAAFTGPNIGRLTREMIPDALFAASYLSVALFCLGIVLIQFFIRIPKPGAEEIQGHKRPLVEILLQPSFLVAALCAMIAYGTMNLLMTSTPLAMHHRGMDFSDTAFVIQWHIVGMFAPSFFTGSLIHRFGVLTIMLTGAVLLLLCTLVALNGQMFSHFVFGLILLGVGWNFLFIGGTTLLTETYLPAEKSTIQGINEFVVFSATAFTAMSSGFLHHWLGWEKLNQYAIPVVCFSGIIIILLWLQRRRLQPTQV
ncbi:MAG: MFS transporter [Pseudomonadota bacterium]